MKFDRRQKKLLLCALLCFCTGLIAAFVQYVLSNARGETNVVLVFDSGHYQESARQIVNALCGANVGTSAPSARLQLAQALMLDGPVLPGLASLSFLTLGKIFAFADWQCLLVVQALLHATSAALLFLVGRQIFEDSLQSIKWPLTAGLLWAINPVAVLAAQRFLIEPLATCMVLALLLLSCRLRRQLSGNFGQSNLNIFFLATLCGIALTSILFTKAGLVPASALVLIVGVYVGVKAKDRRLNASALFLSLAGLALGLVCIIMPWALYTQGATGKAQYFPQRAPVLNLFVGWDLPDDGFSTLPVAPVARQLQEVYDRTGSAPQAVLWQWVNNPQGCFSLLLRKIPRLYSLPWNDFRRGSLFLSPKMQEWLHQIVLLAAFFAFCLSLLCGAPLAVWLALMMVAGHFIFLLFESVPRYAFSSYALLLLLAIYFVAIVCRQALCHRKLLNLSIASVLTLICAHFGLPVGLLPQNLNLQNLQLAAMIQGSVLVVLVLCNLRPSWAKSPENKRRLLIATLLLVGSIYSVSFFYARSHSFFTSELERKLIPGQTAERIIHLPSRQIDSSSALLVIDGVKRIEDCAISVNGQLLKIKPTNLMQYLPHGKEDFLFAQEVAGLMGRSQDDIRRWVAVSIPVALLEPGKDLTLSIQAATTGSIRLFAEPDNVALRLPGYRYISPGKIWTSNDSFEWRAGQSFAADGQPLNGESFLIDASGRRTKQNGTWRMFILTGTKGDIGQTVY